MNEELIKRLRIADRISVQRKNGSNIFEVAADALEAADHRISELEAQLAECQKDAENWKERHDYLRSMMAVDLPSEEWIDAAIKESK